MEPYEVIEEIERLRTESGRNSPVEYVDVFEWERPYGDILFVLVATRADLGAVVSGSRIKQLIKKFGKIIRVISEDELVLRRYRLQKAWKHVRKFLDVDPLFEEFIKYPKVDWKALKNSIDLKASVAYSGGADSKAAAWLLEYSGAEVERIYVKMPKPITIDVPSEARVVEAPEEAKRIVEDALAGKYHPCGRCSKTIEKTVIANASHDPVVFGHLLPTGVGSLRIENKLIRSLPASLAMTKSDTVYLATEGRMDYEYKFGCMLLHQVHRKHKWMRKVSIRRVLREATSGLLMPSQAYEYILSILA